MTLLLGAGAQLLHAALMLAAAPTLTGLLRWLKARLAGRSGPPPFQSWRDLARLARKQPVAAEGSSAVSLGAPAAIFAAIAAAALLAPSFTLGMALAPIADLFVIAGLLALARSVRVLAGMDLGGALGGLGASRSMTLAMFSAPGFALVVLAVSLLAGTTNLDAIAGAPHEGALGPHASAALALVATAMIGLAECGRAPVERPDAQSALAMTARTTEIEYSGREMALLEYAAGLELLLWLDLIAALFLPVGLATAEGGPLAWAMGLAAWAVKIAVLGGALAALETVAGAAAFGRAVGFVAFGGLLALLACLLLFAGTGLA